MIVVGGEEAGSYLQIDKFIGLQSLWLVCVCVSIILLCKQFFSYSIMSIHHNINTM